MTATTTTARKPAARWRLTEVARVTVDDTDWVVYEDGQYRWAVEAIDWDRPTVETDYTEWCQMSDAASDRDICARIAAAARVSGIDCAGDGGRVHAAVSE